MDHTNTWFITRAGESEGNELTFYYKADMSPQEVKEEFARLADEVISQLKEVTR